MRTLLNTSFLLLFLGVIGFFILNKSSNISDLIFWEKEKRTPINYHLLNKEVQHTILSAKKSAIEQAKKELELFHTDIMQKVDSNFLDWYFNYGNQMMLGVKNTWTSIWESEETAKQELQKIIAKKFSTHVMPPAIIQAKIETIAEGTVNKFTYELEVGLKHIPEKYNLTSTEWNRYLNNVSIIVRDIEGHTSQPISLKALVIGGVGVAIAGGTMLAEMAIPAVEAALTEAGIAVGLAETGLILEGSAFGGPIIFGIAAIGLASWEYFDHQETVEENRPILRQHINDYLQNFEQDMLKPSGAIGTPIHQIETAIVNGLRDNL